MPHLPQHNPIDFIHKRNHRLAQLFKNAAMHSAGLADKIRIIGDINSPAVLYEDTYILNMFAHNFDLHFTDAPFEGNILQSYKMTAALRLSPEVLQYHIDNYQHKRVYKVKLAFDGVDLFLAGWNHTNKEHRDESTQYPVFAPREPKVYHTKEKAIDLCIHLGEWGIRCYVV